MVDVDRAVYSLQRQQEEKHTKEHAEVLKLPYVDLAGYPFTADVLSLIPFDSALTHKIIPFLKIGSAVKVGAVEPNSEAVKKYLAEVTGTTGATFAVSVISNTSFLFGLQAYRQEEERRAQQKTEGVGETAEKMTDVIKSLKDVAKAAAHVSTTRAFDMVMIGAVRTGASDVHFEPGESEFLVRFRIDGVLQDAARLPITTFKGLLSRVKYLAKLKMDKINEPQDGRFSITVDEHRIDMRVATLPSAYGEGIVIRLLKQDQDMQRLDKLGFRPDALAMIRQAITRPHGMILNTGPTGSGKTTTLYAILLEIRKPGIKIITLEDPIEYRIEGVEQSQVDPEGNYTFADGLRGSLRADPDVIMVGEIRDAETAQIGVQAALTGHLLLSTIHANSAPAVFPRLLDIGVKPYLLAGSLNLVMAQRLIRLICRHCVEQYEPAEPVWQEIRHSLLPITDRLEERIGTALNQPTKLSRGRGCERCNHTGFSGRQAIIEVLHPTPEFEALIARQATQSEFTETALKQGMISMEQDGLIKVIEGLTTVEEVWRVTKAD